jgi:hypothetical protein
VSEPASTIRSYQRIFRPERRIYQLEGHPLPVPGGVPLRWLAYAAGALAAVLLLSSGSAAFLVLLACLAAGAGAVAGGRAAAGWAALLALACAWLGGLLLGLLDWPLRLLVLPFALATLATQATPDGRSADRFALSWLVLRLAPTRRSLGRVLPLLGSSQLAPARLWVAPDPAGPVLRAARIEGSGTVSFAAPVSVRRSGRRGERLRVRPGSGSGARRGARTATKLAIGTGEVAEVRP